ncbi:hypothetical protein [Streptomyces sp. NPDC006334]|uniref:hypothetical protein n=1 Tax=Streptomyces sp. NPDC006334 TaxID=3156754 RepID=UPI0033A76605
MSAPRIPEEVERLAIRLATDEAKRQAMARTPEGAEAIADQLREEAAAQGLHVKEYVEALTKAPEGVRPPEGTHPTSAFWSFGINDERAPSAWLDNRYIAEAWAELQNQREPGTAQTLETSAAGRRLNGMHLWEPEVLEALGGAEQGFTQDWTRECWGNISETYAAAAKGPVAVFAQYADTRSILYNRELPTLHGNGDVGLDNIHFAYEAPQAWPQETRTELGTDAARAVLQFNDPTQAHYVDPVAYPTQDPAQRQAALRAELAAVATERAERAARRHAEQETAHDGEVKAQPSAEAHPAATPTAEADLVQAPSPPAPAKVPVWQLGFNPKPTVAAPASTTPAAESKAPPSPDLGRQATGTGLG